MQNIILSKDALYRNRAQERQTGYLYGTDTLSIGWKRCFMAVEADTSTNCHLFLYRNAIVLQARLPP